MNKTEIEIFDKTKEAKKILNVLFLKQMGIDSSHFNIAAVDNFVDLMVEISCLTVAEEIRKSQ